ncbi:uncharacterized protein [Onthophagus taurus]|uniref:uncharacterized protein n=1 Tax=Onthophagus taurus TaxID=166361 RepID=UPI0039BE0269
MAAKDDVEDLTSNFREMSVEEDDINILLLGETGVGKSTFINSFTNYLQYRSLDLAEKSELKCLIPAKFEVEIEKDGKLERHTISVGSNKDTNENRNIVTAATQGVRSYVFPVPDFNNKKVRIIDTPGICDDRGIEQDKTNLENILSYIGRIQTLHGICILLRPNVARLTPALEYCIIQLLSKLEKSAGEIITFVFTNSRGSSYKPQDSSSAILSLLEKIAKKPPNVVIKYDMDNIFCLDNESFRYLAALKQNHDTGDRILKKQSWDKSSDECYRLIKYLIGEGPNKPKPHDVRRTISVNKARQVIMELSRPLADITELIDDNLTALRNHQKLLKQEVKSIDDLNGKLYIPVIDLEQIECPKPKTVCHNSKCCEKYSVGDITKLHYKQRCHDPCFLTNVAREIVGDTELKHCAAMDHTGKCKLCGCDFSAHMHIYYETRTVNGQIEGEGIRTQINDMTLGMKEREKVIKQIEIEMNEYEKEKDIIIKSMAKFAHFLERNAITPFNDAYQNYIKILIARERGRGPECNLQQIKNLKDMLNQYNEEKKILQNALNTPVVGHLKPNDITPNLIIKEIKDLFSLNKMGEKIKNMHEMQKKGEAVEHRNTEYVLPQSKNSGLKRNTHQAPRGKGSNKVNMIHEDGKFKNNKKTGQDKSFPRDKMQNFGRNYQKQQQNHSNQKGYQQKNWKEKNTDSTQNQFPRTQNQNRTQQHNIPPLMQPNQFPPNFYQGFPINFQMQPPPQFNYAPQFPYPNIPPNAYPPNPHWNNYPPNHQPPNLYPNVPNYPQQPPNSQEKTQNVPMNNMEHPSFQKEKKDKSHDSNLFYEELYSNNSDNQKTEKSKQKYGNNYRDDNNKVPKYQDSDSDNEGAAKFDKFRKQKGNENYADLYGDDDDDDKPTGNKINSLMSGFKNLFN